MMNRIPFMKAPTTAQTNNDSLFLNRNVPSVPTKDPTLQTIEEEIGKISLQHRQFKNETIEEIDSRIQRYGLEIKNATSGLATTMKNLQTITDTIQRTLTDKPQEPINVDILKQELMTMIKEAKPTDDGSVNLKELIGKNLNGMRQDINRLREAAPVFPNYDKELVELKQSVDALRVHVTGSTASKNDVNSLFGIVGSMKTPIDELRRTLAGLDLSSLPKPTPAMTISAKDITDVIAKNNKEIGDMVGKSSNNVLQQLQTKMDQAHKPILEKIDSQQRAVKEIIEAHQRSLLQTISANKLADNLSALLDSKLNSFFDRIKNEVVIKMAERLDEVLMQTRKLENYLVESRSQFSDSIRAITKKIDDSFLDKDTREILEKGISDFMIKNRPQIMDGVSNHITEDMIVILRELKERNSTVKTEVVEPKPEAKVVQKPNPFSPFKKG